MATCIWMLELGRTYWRLHAGADGSVEHELHEFENPNLVEQAGSIHDLLKSAGYRGEPIIVALSAAWTIAATIEVGRQKELRDRKTMLFRLEEHIPWSVEDCVIDYIGCRAKALMVAVLEEPLSAFFRQLQTLGIHAQSIVPLPLLAAQEHLDRGGWPTDHIVLLEHQGWSDMLIVQDKEIASWLSFPSSEASILLEISRIHLESGQPSPVVGYQQVDTASSIQILSSRRVIDSPVLQEESCISLARAACAKIARGRMSPPIDLMREQFGRRRGNPALRKYSVGLKVATALLLLVFCAAMLYRGQIAKQQADLLTAKQVDLYREVLPNAKVPVGIKARMESELAKLRGLKGDDVAIPASVSAGAVLRRMLAAMPTDRRFRLLEIRIEDGRLYLDGEVIEHGDAELIVQRLRANGFEVSSPRTQRLDDKRISLRISGTIAPITKVAARSSS